MTNQSNIRDGAPIQPNTIEEARSIAELLKADPTYETPFQRRIARYIDIDDDCRRFLRKLQSDPIVLRAGVALFNTAHDARDIYVVQSGWLLGYSFTPGGQRHVYRIYQPGDLVGIEDINWNYHTSNVETATPCAVTVFSKSTLRTIFEDSPRLARTIFSMAMMDQAHLFDKLRAVGRMSAETRMAALLLQLYSRTALTNSLPGKDTIDLPLTQSEIGDAIGLTNVSVSRTLTSLEQQGLIRRDGKNVVLLDRERLARKCDYNDRTLRVDRDWVGAMDQQSLSA